MMTFNNRKNFIDSYFNKTNINVTEITDYINTLEGQQDFNSLKDSEQNELFEYLGKNSSNSRYIS